MKKYLVFCIVLITVVFTGTMVMADTNFPPPPDPTYRQDGVAPAYINNLANELALLDPFPYPHKVLWWRTWGSCPTNPPGCIPQSTFGENPGLPVGYDGYVLLFNEPNIQGGGSNYMPYDQAVPAYMAFRSQFPNAKIVVGNISLWTPGWYEFFYNLCIATPGCIAPNYVGWHEYTDNLQDARNSSLFLDSRHDVQSHGAIMWITEFGDTNGDIYNDTLMVKAFRSKPYIERWAYFTNRAQENEVWWPSMWDNMQLFDWNTDALTDQGIWFRQTLYCSDRPDRCTNYFPLILKDNDPYP